MDNANDQTTRRDFFRHMGRAVAGVAIGATAVVSIRGRRANPAAGPQKCINDKKCGGCTVLQACQLPLAMMYRGQGR